MYLVIVVSGANSVPRILEVAISQSPGKKNVLMEVRRISKSGEQKRCVALKYGAHLSLLW